VKHATFAFNYGAGATIVARSVSTPQQKFTRKNAEKLKQAIEARARRVWTTSC
jgi:hypothetical protein